MIQEHKTERNIRPANGVLRWSGYKRITVDEGWELVSGKRELVGGLRSIRAFLFLVLTPNLFCSFLACFTQISISSTKIGLNSVVIISKLSV